MVAEKKQARRARLAKSNGIKLDEAKNYQKAKRMVAKYHEKFATAARIICISHQTNRI